MPVRSCPLFIDGRWINGDRGSQFEVTGYTHEIPFGGFKENGLGREGGRQGIAEYMEVKSISLNIT